jgi:hypothetical protein
VMTKKKKRAEPLCEDQRQLAWAQLGQLMHLVSMDSYPPKPKTPTPKEEGDHDNDNVRPD